MKTKNAII